MMAFVILLAVIFFNWLQTSVASNNMTSVTFDKITTTCGPQRLSPGWLDRSKISCAVNCTKRYTTGCRSFLYNNLTKLCTPAGDINHLNPQATATEGDLYYQTSPPFSVFCSTTSSVKAVYVIAAVNYATAELACQRLNSRLFVTDTMEKFRLLAAIMTPPQYTWIGLDDRAVEGTYVWANSSGTIDPTLKSAIFHSNQPDNGYGSNQDCVAVRQDSLKLDDIECVSGMGYICERPTVS